MPTLHPKAIVLINKMNLKLAFGLSLSEIDEMDCVERRYWSLMARNIERRKRIDIEMEKAKARSMR